MKYETRGSEETEEAPSSGAGRKHKVVVCRHLVVASGLHARPYIPEVQCPRHPTPYMPHLPTIYICICLCACVCVCEREREREDACIYMIEIYV